MNNNSLIASLTTGLNKPEDLYTAIFASDSPEKLVPELPVQSLYLCIQARGLASSTDLLPLVTQEQYQKLLHFDFWEKDNFSEENFWLWLETIDEQDSRKPLQRFLQAFDRSLLAFLVYKHLDVVFHEEPSEAPPGDDYYTPDHGHTWLQIKVEDEDRLRLFGKLLAFIFELDAKTFYQFVGISKLATTTELEEKAYQRKIKDLSQEGIPDMEFAWQINAMVTKAQLLNELNSSAKRGIVEYQITNFPILKKKSQEDIFGKFANSIREHSAEEYNIFLSEISLIANAGLVYTQSDFSDYEEMLLLLQKIRGAICIGLEELGETGRASVEIYLALGLQKIYKLGMTCLTELSKNAKKITEEKLEGLSEENKVIIEYAMEQIPSLPEFYLEDRDLPANTKLELHKKAYTSKKQVESVASFISQCLQS